MTEAQLHRQVADFLRVALGGCAFAFHIPNGGKRPRGEAGKLKGMLTIPGVPDLCITDGGRALFLELKSAKGSVSPAQKACHAALGRAGCPVAVCKTLDEVIATLTQWGVPLKLSQAA